ncbi:MAG TPA: hypothetical protein VLM83_11940, partial [Anaerolineales bacterium]|nr:hypothetical protein [Anaerolineales bacterium]
LPSQQSLHILLFVMGLVLIVGGVAAGKPGASIGGLIVAAVNFQLWQRTRSGRGEEKTNG